MKDTCCTAEKFSIKYYLYYYYYYCYYYYYHYHHHLHRLEWSGRFKRMENDWSEMRGYEGNMKSREQKMDGERSIKTSQRNIQGQRIVAEQSSLGMQDTYFTAEKSSINYYNSNNNINYYWNGWTFEWMESDKIPKKIILEWSAQGTRRKLSFENTGWMQ